MAKICTYVMQTLQVVFLIWILLGVPNPLNPLKGASIVLKPINFNSNCLNSHQKFLNKFCLYNSREKKKKTCTYFQIKFFFCKFWWLLNIAATVYFGPVRANMIFVWQRLCRNPSKIVGYYLQELENFRFKKIPELLLYCELFNIPLYIFRLHYLFETVLMKTSLTVSGASNYFAAMLKSHQNLKKISFENK